MWLCQCVSSQANELGFASLLICFHHSHCTRGQENIYKRETVNTEPWNTVFIRGSFTHWTIFVYEFIVSLMSSLFHTLKCYIIITINSGQIDGTCMCLAWNFDSLIVLYTNEVFGLFSANMNIAGVILKIAPLLGTSDFQLILWHYKNTQLH